MIREHKFVTLKPSAYTLSLDWYVLWLSLSIGLPIALVAVGSSARYYRTFLSLVQLPTFQIDEAIPGFPRGKLHVHFERRQNSEHGYVISRFLWCCTLRTLNSCKLRSKLSCRHMFPANVSLALRQSYEQHLHHPIAD